MEYIAGWLDRDGNFYGCNMGSHDHLAHELFNKEVKELEDTGWCRVWDIYAKSPYQYIAQKPLSVDQRNWLSLNGITLLEWDE